MYAGTIQTTFEEREVLHRRAVAERLFAFGQQVLDFARAYAAPLAGRRDAPGKSAFNRQMDILCRLARRFERLASMAMGLESLPVNRERLEADVARVREVVVGLTLGTVDS